MSSILETLRGKKVQIWSEVNGLRDDGVLVDFDDKWVHIQKTGSKGSQPENLYFPITSVRLIKLV